MAEKADHTIATEVHSRLDDLFGQSAESNGPVKGGSGSEGLPLKDLKAIILSIDWEITDEIMTQFMEQMGILQERYKENKVFTLFFRLLSSVGKYIKTSKANAHPDAIKLFNSIYNSLETVFSTEGMTEAEKKQALRLQMEKFNKLKEQIALRKRGAVKGKVAAPSEKIRPAIEVQKGIQLAPGDKKPPYAPDNRGMLQQEFLAYALEEIKQFIKAEFHALTEELKLWKEEQQV
ncbi:MAG: hypothetical protein SV775_08180 [Thermodesulfobacteriota bacterium]|nr:hypothetical protein [Thermodesulfobacteriota bacterium]